MKSVDFGGRIWIHHADSREDLIRIVDAGYRGIECDIYYSEEYDDIIVTHDLPYKKPVIPLEDYFKYLQNSETILWLDLKEANLGHITKLSAKLKELERRYRFENRYFVESPKKIHQILLSRRGFNTVLWLSSLDSTSVAFYGRNVTNKIAILLGDFIAISLPFEVYNEEVRDTYND